jgi:THUMP domain-like
MIDKLLQKNVRNFIEQHANDDEQQLLLRYTEICDLPARLIAWQISGRRKAKIKIPLFYNTPNVLYPPGINLEQSSSEDTGLFKASILSTCLPFVTSLVDLTGGFGVDTFFFSKKVNHVTYVEPNAELFSYARQNHITLGAENIQHINATAETFLDSLTAHVNAFFIDPSRRSASNKKVFRMTDCEPDVIKLLPRIFAHAKYLMVKGAPLLDIQQAMRELRCVEHVWVVSVKNEVKELLFICSKERQEGAIITAVNLTTDHEQFSFQVSEEQQATITFSEPLNYIYEPNAAILKAGAFKLVGEKFSVAKLHPNTHLYTSNDLVRNFPGRIFKPTGFLKADAKEAGSYFSERKANVITRNYPLSPDQLRKKLRLQDGGDLYLIACSGVKQKFLIAADRLK